MKFLKRKFTHTHRVRKLYSCFYPACLQAEDGHCPELGVHVLAFGRSGLKRVFLRREMPDKKAHHLQEPKRGTDRGTDKVQARLHHIPVPITCTSKDAYFIDTAVEGRNRNEVSFKIV